MNTLEKLISNAKKTPESEIYFTGIEIVNRGKTNEYYIDPRTRRNTAGLMEVIPFCFHGGAEWYVCPDCGKLHYTIKSGKSETGCCTDIDCERIEHINGKYFVIQRDPVVILEAVDSEKGGKYDEE